MKKMIFRLEEERRHIARELHDELGQRLTALKMELASLLLPTQLQGVPHERIEAMLGMVDDTVASVRRIAANLRPTMLDDLGLHAAIEWLASESSRRIGIQVVVHFEETEPPVSAAASIVLYRIVQEALTNVARHARATTVEIELLRQDQDLVLSVQDNGIGFSAPPSLDHSLGLRGIRERARMLGGHMQIEPGAGGGTRLVVRLPLLSSTAPTPPCAAGEC